MNTLPDAINTGEAEHEVWSGTPSQWQNLGWWLGCLLVIPIPFAAWAWLATRSTRYVLSDQRLKITRGVFNRVIEDIELYRVKDTRLTQTFWQRMVGIGDVELGTSDQSSPVVRLASLPDAEAVRDRLRSLVEKRRDSKRVREVDVGHEAL